MKPKPILFSTDMVRAILDGRKTKTRRVMKPQPESMKDGKLPKCPYQPGDILWVRETWAKRIHSDNRYYYKADNNLGAVFNRENDKWRPSIHMPREAARLFLLVKAVRVERLQEITPEEIDREGTPFGMTLAPYAGFSELWDIIHAKRGYGWESNPWVWAVDFERTEVPHDQ